MATSCNDEASPHVVLSSSVTCGCSTQTSPTAGRPPRQQGQTFVYIFFLDSLTLRDWVNRFCPKRRYVTANLCCVTSQKIEDLVHFTLYCPVARNSVSEAFDVM